MDFSLATEDFSYLFVVFAIYPFVCRQRFFYYLSGVGLTSLLDSILKLSFHAPRPVWLWSDIQCYGSSPVFASPSGHTSAATFMVFFVILDTFFASNYSRKRHPSSNAFILSQNLPVFLTAIVLGLFFILMVIRNRLFLGKHTYD